MRQLDSTQPLAPAPRNPILAEHRTKSNELNFISYNFFFLNFITSALFLLHIEPSFFQLLSSTQDKDGCEFPTTNRNRNTEGDILMNVSPKSYSVWMKAE